MEVNKILNGDALTHLKELPSESINCVMTSPPYWALRDYGIEGQLGLEPTFDEFINKLCDIFDEVKRVLRKDGTCWVNLGDTYYGSGAGTQKNLPENPKCKESYVMPYVSHKHTQRNKGWTRPSRIESNKAVSNKNCLYCGKEIKGKPNSQFCSRKCLNKLGNEFRSQRRMLPDKCLTQVPFRFSIEMVNRGWILRNVIIWHKPNCMPSSVKDRFTVDFEYIFFFSKSKKYWFERQYEEFTMFENRPPGVVRNREYGYQGKYKVTRKRNYGGRTDNFTTVSGTVGNPERGRNKRTVWSIPTKPFPDAHFAVYPEALCETPIKSGCPEGGVVLDPFFGSGTTGVVALKNKRQFIGIELNPEYIEIANKRLKPLLEQRRLKWNPEVT